MSSVPRLPPDSDDVQLVTPTAPTAAATTTAATAAADGNSSAAATPSSFGARGIGAAARALPLPNQGTICDDKYLDLRAVLAAEVIRRRLHVVVKITEQSDKWKQFYSDCLNENGVMNKFMFSTSATPGKRFRGIVFAGIELDAERYSARGACGEEPSELEIMSSIIIAERSDALAAYQAANAAKKDKANKGRAENEAAEAQLGLRGASGLATPSPTTTLLGNKPMSLFG